MKHEMRYLLLHPTAKRVYVSVWNRHHQRTSSCFFSGLSCVGPQCSSPSKRSKSAHNVVSTNNSFSTRVGLDRQQQPANDGDEWHQDVDDFSFDPYENDEEASHEANDGQPWKRLLESAARAAWRVSDAHHPEAVTKARSSILDEAQRTPRQLLRSHRKTATMQEDLAEMRERERRRLVNGKYYRGKDLPEEGSLEPILYAYTDSLASLKHRLLPNYAITKRVLEESQSLLGSSLQPKQILDFGIGCGSASVAALDAFPKVPEWVHGIDPSPAMRDCSQRMIERMAKEADSPVIPRVTHSSSLNHEENSSSGSFDLALYTYTATDLPDISSNLTAAALLFEKLKPGGILVMIEPGTPDGFNSIRSVRNMLLDCCPPDDPDFEWEHRCHILAPCTHNGKCPMERHKKKYVKKGKLPYDLPHQAPDFEEKEQANETSHQDTFLDEDFVELTSNDTSSKETQAFNSSFCSFVQTMPDSDGKGEKFSYLVAQKRPFGSDESHAVGFEKDNVADLLVQAQAVAEEDNAMKAQGIFNEAQELETRYLDPKDNDQLGLNLVRGTKPRSAMGRIIRAPIKKKGHVYIDYCASPGRIVRGRVTKASNNFTPGIFAAARKSRWGGYWPDTMEKVYSVKKK